jgi:DNA-binding response OmpR family regulator
MIARRDPIASTLLDDHDDLPPVLAGTVAMSVGRGGPVQAAVTRGLKAAGAIVIAKTSAVDALEILRAFVPSVVVTEVVPDDDGSNRLLDAIRALPAERGGNLPVIGVSWETLDPAPVIRAGFQDALVGPFDAVDVARTVLKAVRRSS